MFTPKLLVRNRYKLGLGQYTGSSLFLNQNRAKTHAFLHIQITILCKLGYANWYTLPEVRHVVKKAQMKKKVKNHYGRGLALSKEKLTLPQNTATDSLYLRYGNDGMVSKCS